MFGDDLVAKRYPEVAAMLQVESPITVVDVTVELPGTRFSFGRKTTQVGGTSFENCVVFADCAFDVNAEA
jgi:hypothetical protein